MVKYIFTEYPLLRSGEVNNSRIYVSFQRCARENVCARECTHRLLPQFVVVSVDLLVIILKKRILMGTRKKKQDRRYRKVRKIEIKNLFLFLSLVFRSFVLNAFVVLSSIPSLVSLYSLSLPLSLSKLFFCFFCLFSCSFRFPHMADQTRFNKKKYVDFYEKCSLPLDLPTIY